MEHVLLFCIQGGYWRDPGSEGRLVDMVQVRGEGRGDVLMVEVAHGDVLTMTWCAV